MTDFQTLEKDIYEATKTAFCELVERSHPETICAFALYSDEGAMTVCPAANTVAHLAKEQKANPDFTADYTFSPAEWTYESVGADELFKAICEQLSARLTELPADESAFDHFRNELFATCFRVLKMLKAENFFESTVGGPVMLLFSVSDADINAHEVEWVRELNNAETGDAYEEWAQMFNEF